MAGELLLWRDDGARILFDVSLTKTEPEYEPPFDDRVRR